MTLQRIVIYKDTRLGSYIMYRPTSLVKGIVNPKQHTPDISVNNTVFIEIRNCFQQSLSRIPVPLSLERHVSVENVPFKGTFVLL